MRRPCEALANNTLSTPDPCAVTTLSAGFGVACSAGIIEVGRGRKVEAYANVPAWLTNTPQHVIPSTDFTDAPHKETLHGQNPALG